MFEQQGLFSKLDTDRFASDEDAGDVIIGSRDGQAGDSIIGSRDGQALAGTSNESAPSTPSVDLFTVQGQENEPYYAPDMDVFGPSTNNYSDGTYSGSGTGIESLGSGDSSSYGTGSTENPSNTGLPTGLDDGLGQNFLMLSGQELVDALLNR